MAAARSYRIEKHESARRYQSRAAVAPPTLTGTTGFGATNSRPSLLRLVVRASKGIAVHNARPARPDRRHLPGAKAVCPCGIASDG